MMNMSTISLKPPVVLVMYLILTNSTQAMPYRTAAVFFAVHNGTEVLAVQSNPILVWDESGSDTYTLNLDGVFTAPGGGGLPVSGFTSESGAVSSAVNIYATPAISDYRWVSGDPLYAHFTLIDVDLTPLESFDLPLHLRTINTIDFSYTAGGAPFPIAIGGGIPPSGSVYEEFTNFGFTATPKGNLLGTNGGTDADIRFGIDALGTQASLWVDSPPYDASTPMWDIDNGLLDLTIATISTNPFSTCEAHFDGLNYLGDPDLSAQPTLTLYPPGILIDIKPGDCTNKVTIPPKNRAKIRIQVAIMGSADFDVTSVAPASVMLEDVPSVQVAVADSVSPDCSTADPDGYDDLILHFRAADVLDALELSDDATVLLTLSGFLREEFGNASIEGTQMVTFSFVGKPR
jgi:hypothetical protein